MDIGIGLPVTVPSAPPEDVLGWARRAEEAGFSSLATLDRIAYPNYDPIVALAVAGAVTSRIRLTTTVLLGPARGNGAVLAKQAMSVHRLSGGRLVLGLAVGARPGDYEAAGEAFHRRGRGIEALVPYLRNAFDDADGIGPHLRDGAPPLLLGGHSDTAIARAARLGDGWISGGSSGAPYRDRADRVRKAWSEAGRDTPPRLVALMYAALGPDAPAHVTSTLGAFYAGTGPYAARAQAEALVTPAAVAAAVTEHAEAGCDELILMPCASAPDQVDRLREALP